MRALPVLFLLLATHVGSAQAQSGFLFRGGFAITQVSSQCAGHVQIGDGGLIRLGSALTGGRSALSLFEDAVSQSFRLPSGLFDDTDKAVEAVVVEASPVESTVPVTVRFTKQQPGALANNTTFLSLTASINGFRGIEDCRVAFRAVLTKNID